MNIYGNREGFYQWDINQKLTSNLLAVGDEVHFTNMYQHTALVTVAYELDGKIVVDVPNILLQSSASLKVYWMYIDGEGEFTKAEYTFNVTPRKKPSDYVYTETELLNYKYLDFRISKLENNGGTSGKDGEDGKSAYEIALEHGFEGSESEWLESLNGADGKDAPQINDTYPTIDNPYSGARVEKRIDTRIEKPYTNNLGETYLPDSDNGVIKNIVFRGRSMQDATPTPNVPQEIKSVDNIAIKIADNKSNVLQTVSIPHVLRGLPVSSGGNYTDKDGQQWICDEVDVERGVLVQRIYRYDFTGAETMILYDNGKLVGSRFNPLGIPECNCPVTNSANNLSAIASNVAQATTQGTLTSGKGRGVAVSNWGTNGANLFFDVATYGGINEFKASAAKAYANGTPWYIVYALATPIETPLSAEEIEDHKALCTARGGTNIIFNSENGVSPFMSFEYAVDIRKRLEDWEKHLADSSFDPLAYGLPVLHLIGDIAPIAVSKDNKVTLSYVYRDFSGTCTLKGQGSSSYVMAQTLLKAGKAGKFNYAINFDKAFEAVDGWGDQTKYCLKANWIDHSHARNVVSAKLWSLFVKSRSKENTNLSGLVNGGAVDGFPVVIMLNGEFHGLYTFNIPKDGWMFGLVENSTKTQAIVAAGNRTSATKFKGESLGNNSDFEVEFVSDKNNVGWVTTSLNTLINACINSWGGDLDDVVGQYVDWESAIDYFIFIAFLKGTDMIDKNYLLTTFDGTKWSFTAYDMDSTYGLKWDGSAITRAIDGATLKDCANNHRLWELIYKFKTDELKSRYEALRSGVLSESIICELFENFAWAIPSSALLEDVKKYPSVMGSSVNGVDQICRWVRQRLEIMDLWISTLPKQETPIKPANEGIV